MDKLLMYCIIEVASERTPRTEEQKFNRVVELNTNNQKLIWENWDSETDSILSVLEIQNLKAQKQFLETKIELSLEKNKT